MQRRKVIAISNRLSFKNEKYFLVTFKAVKNLITNSFKGLGIIKKGVSEDMKILINRFMKNNKKRLI